MPKLTAPVGPSPGGPTPIPAPTLIRNSVLECATTAALLFVIVSAVRWVIGDTNLATDFGSLHVQVSIIAAIAALTVLAIIVSPPGRRSGAHINPAVTIALWLMRAFPAVGVLPYVTAQLAGSMLGVALARLAWGDAAARAPVRYALVGAAAGWTWWQVALVEAACLVVVTLAVGFFLAHPTSRVRSALPFVLSAITFASAAGLGTLSGASVNPARQFGPAIWSGDTTLLAVYLLAPLVGAAIGARIHLVLVSRPVTTFKLSGDP